MVTLLILISMLNFQISRSSSFESIGDLFEVLSVRSSAFPSPNKSAIHSRSASFRSDDGSCNGTVIVHNTTPATYPMEQHTEPVPEIPSHKNPRPTSISIPSSPKIPGSPLKMTRWPTHDPINNTEGEREFPIGQAMQVTQRQPLLTTGRTANHCKQLGCAVTIITSLLALAVLDACGKLGR